MIVHLIRHGETIWNRDKLFQGQSDIELTELGKKQSHSVASKILECAPKTVYTSPLSRAKYIADLISKEIGSSSIQIKNMIELDLGELEGKTGEDLRANWPDIISNWRSHPSRVKMPSGESFAQLHDRVTAGLHDLIKSQDESPIVVVSHNFVIKLLICHVLGLTVDSLHKIHVDLASVSSILVEEGHSSLLALNGISHLNYL